MTDLILYALVIAGWGGAILLSLAGVAYVALLLFGVWLEREFADLFPRPWWLDEK